MQAVRGAEWIPQPYQKVAVKFLLQNANAGLLLGPGGRKTSCTLAALKILFDKAMINRVLIVAPKKPCYNVWPGEIEKWACFNDLTYAVLHGPKKEEALASGAQICMINPEGIDWLLSSVKTKYTVKTENPFTGAECHPVRTRVAVDVAAFKLLGFDVLVLDELHLWKNQHGQRYMALEKVVPTFRRRIGLTGSPSANGLTDLFGQCYVLDMGRCLGRFITHFRRDFCESDHTGAIWTIREGAEERIYERVAPLLLRLDSEAQQQLPELVVNKIMLDLPPKIREVYDEMEGDLITGIENHVIRAPNAAGASNKCQQIAAGGIFHRDKLIVGKAAPKREFTNLHEEKTNALIELADELQGQRLLVAYDFEHDLDRLRTAFGKRPRVVFARDVPDQLFLDLEQRWNDGQIDILFGHPKSIALGLNLQGDCHHVAWHTPTWDFVLYDQFNRRVRRDGNKFKAVFVHQLTMRDTVEEAMFGLMDTKDASQQGLFNALLKYSKTRRAV